jgi:hypothetical protein
MRRPAALLAAALLSCSQPDDRTPEGAVAEFIAAAARGDAVRVVQMIDAATLARLRARAREASDLAGGGVDLDPVDLVAVGFEPARMEVKDVRRRSLKGADAVVLVQGTDGRNAEVRLRSEQHRWKVVLDL